MEKKTIEIKISEGQTLTVKGIPVLFRKVFMVKKFSRFITKLPEDQYMVIEVLQNTKTGELFTDNLPVELRTELEKYTLENID